MRIVDTCDKCGQEFEKHEWKALMKDYRVLCKKCYDTEKEAEKEQ